jgi:hypothetical protein
VNVSTRKEGEQKRYGGKVAQLVVQFWTQAGGQLAMGLLSSHNDGLSMTFDDLRAINSAML